MSQATEQVRAPDSIGYGTAGELAGMLDGIGAILAEEHQGKWDTDSDLRASTEALYEHLWRRLHPARTGSRS